MTGFGREEKLINNKKIVIEIRTVNSKGLDINLKVHDSFSFILEYLRKSVKEKIIILDPAYELRNFRIG